MSNHEPDVIPKNSISVGVNPGERFLDNMVAQSIIALGYFENEATQKTAWKEFDAVAAELAGPHPNPTELILARVAALDWLVLRVWEAQYALKLVEGMQFARSEHDQRRIDRTHRRLMSTVRTLAAVRKLALPAVQVNIANVNGAAKQPAGSKQHNGNSVFGNVFDQGVFAGLIGDVPEGQS